MKNFGFKKMESCHLYYTIKSRNWEIIDEFIENGADINASLISTGLEAGYTALHFAAMESNDEHVKRLIRIFEADVNSASKDGTQPIHLACLLGNYRVAEMLLVYGANPDADLTRDLVEKYAKNKKWSDEFGSTMTLLTFSVINCDWNLCRRLLDYHASFGIKSISNKTLLMYAVKNNYFYIANLFISKMENYPELIDARDDNGWHVIHYFQFIKEIKTSDDDVLIKLIRTGADINAIINGDPDSLIVNIMASKYSESVLSVLLSLNIPLADKSKALYYATRSVDSKESKFEKDESIDELERRRQETIKLVLENYVFRRKFGMFVPEVEKKLMDYLVANDVEVKKIVEDYENDFINGILKNEVIEHQGCGKMNFYEAVRKIFNNNSLGLIVRSDELVKAFKALYSNRYTYNHKLESIINSMMSKIKNAYERKEILEKVEKIRDLRKAVPLPFELVLIIIEYLDNKSLARFVVAFYRNPNSIRFKKCRY